MVATLTTTRRAQLLHRPAVIRTLRDSPENDEGLPAYDERA